MRLTLSSQVAVCCRASLAMDGRERPSPHELLLRLYHCGPLLDVRGQSFFRILTLEEQLLVLALDRQRRLHRDLPSRLDRALDPSNRLGGFVRRTELLGVLHHVFHESVTLVDVIDGAQFLRL